jgi:hypothetical protein
LGVDFGVALGVAFDFGVFGGGEVIFVVLEDG